MLNQNLNTDIGLGNGTQDFIYDIVKNNQGEVK